MVALLLIVSCGDANRQYVRKAIRIMDKQGLFAEGPGWESAKAEALSAKPGSLEEAQEIVRTAAARGDTAIFNNAAQTWNHTFYWNSLAPSGKGGAPSAALLAAVESAFGSLDACKAALADAAVKRFGSGWAWLVAENGKVKVESTPNAETPITRPDAKPLLVVDVWEHAYYLDWQNLRADYVKAVVGGLLDWNAASRRFA